MPDIEMRTVTVPYRLGGRVEHRQVIAEYHTDDLAIVPALTLDGGFSGTWRVTHAGTGQSIVGLSMCLPCARHAMTLLVTAPIDWGRDRTAISADAAARTAATRVADIAFTCRDARTRAGTVDGEA